MGSKGVVTREQLLESVWKYESKGETNIVDVYIRYLRGKIDLPGQKSYIKTVRGIGYAMQDELEWTIRILKGFECFYVSKKSFALIFIEKTKDWERVCVWDLGKREIIQEKFNVRLYIFGKYGILEKN